MTKQKLFKKTNKDFIASLPRFLYDGPIEIIDQKDAAETTVQKLLQAGGILGFDTETRPSFKRGEGHKVALLQIADKEMLFVPLVKDRADRWPYRLIVQPRDTKNRPVAP